MKRILILVFLLVFATHIRECTSCAHGLKYCGHEIRKYSSSQFTVRYDQLQYLYRCSFDSFEFVSSCNFKCVSGASHCGCKPNALYCGHELKDFSVSANTLYRCSYDGERVNHEKTCRERCVASSPSTCSQNCISGRNYCGRELAQLDGWPSFTYSEYDSLYYCSDGSKAKPKYSCKYSCVKTSGSSFCACSPNTLYCGHEIKDSSFAALISYTNDNTLYRCSNDGKSLSTVKYCQGSCTGSSPSLCTQKCIAGRNYCGRELAQLDGWPSFTYSEYDSLYYCSDGSKAKSKYSCKYSCVKTSGGSFCACSPNTLYCGHEIKDSSFAALISYTNDNTLYRCSNDGKSLSTVKYCQGSCIRSSPSSCTQDCIVGRNYCGRELAQLDGWTSVTSSNYDNLYYCTNGSYTQGKQCRHSCINSSGRSFCSCSPNSLECGHTLKDYYTVSDNNIYRCSSNGAMVHFEKSCRGSCVNSSPPSCSENCVVGRYYCGRQLENLEGWKIGTSSSGNNLYLCTNGTQAAYKKSCIRCVDDSSESYCKDACMENNTYCGFELNKFKGWSSNHSPNSLYQCSNDRMSAIKLTDCKGTCKEALNSYCAQSCSIGVRYCGHELSKLESWTWITEQHKKNLYLCTNITSIQHVEDCKDVCKKESDILSYCYLSNCTVGRMYCGHELEGWPNTDLNSLYQCTSPTEVIFNKTCQGMCVLGVSDSECAQSCAIEQNYCGHELQKLERWKGGIIADALYKCNGSSGVLIEKCHGRCRVEAGKRFCSTPCRKNWKYCDSQLNMLEGWNVNENNTLYKCVSDFLAEVIKTCDGRCTSDKERYSFCEECMPNTRYCGTTLQGRERGYVLKPSNIYSCNSEKKLEVYQTCENDCFNSNREPFCDGCKPDMIIIDELVV